MCSSVGEGGTRRLFVLQCESTKGVGWDGMDGKRKIEWITNAVRCNGVSRVSCPNEGVMSR